NRPLLVTATAPVAVRPFCTSNVVPRSVAEPTETVPAKVVAPVAALVCVRAPVMATAPLKLVAPAWVTVTGGRPVAAGPPAAPERPLRVGVPVRALRVRLSLAPPGVPLVAPVTVMSPARGAPCVERATAAPWAGVSAPPMLRVVLVVVTLLAREAS